MDEQIKEYLRQIEEKVQDLTASLHQIESQLTKEINQHRQAQIAFQKVKQELQILATIDSLTQIPNRRCFDQYLNQEWIRLAREQASLSLLLCDVDYFKGYNDTYGHQAGDNCLKMVAQTFKQVAQRPADLVARYAGDEFTVILPNTNLSGAVKIGEKLLIEVANLKMPHPSSDISQVVTISIGIASQIPTRQQSPEALVSKADRALYQAKAEGKNRLVVSSS